MDLHSRYLESGEETFQRPAHEHPPIRHLHLLPRGRGR